MDALKELVEENISMVGIVSKRLRQRKGMSQSHISEETGIPSSSYHDMECGISTRIHKRICILANFWRENGFPEVTEKYLILGTDKDQDSLKTIMLDIQTKARKKDMHQVLQLLEVKSQLDMFSSITPEQAGEIKSLQITLDDLIREREDETTE